jgi:hypothetical protein
MAIEHQTRRPPLVNKHQGRGEGPQLQAKSSRLIFPTCQTRSSADATQELHGIQLKHVPKRARLSFPFIMITGYIASYTPFKQTT